MLTDIQQYLHIHFKGVAYLEKQPGNYYVVRLGRKPNNWQYGYVEPLEGGNFLLYSADRSQKAVGHPGEEEKAAYWLALTSGETLKLAAQIEEEEL